VAFLRNLILSFIPEGLEGDHRFRAMLLAILMATLAVVGAIYNGFYFRAGNPIGGWAIIAQVVVLVAMLFHLKRTGLIARTLHIAVAGFMLMMAAITLSSGGALYSATPWAAVPTMWATLVVGLSAGRLWFLISIGFFILTFLAQQFGVSFPDLISDDPADAFWVSLLDFLHYMGCVLFYGVVTLVFDLINRQAMNEAAHSLDRAREASERAEAQNRYLAESVERILEEMHALANGNLTARLEVAEQDEIGRLCEGFNTAVARVHETIREVAEAVGVTVDSSEQIAAATDQLASGARQQTESVQALSSAINEIVTALEHNAQSAANGSDAARQNGEVARQGGEVVHETIDKIEQIAGVVDQSARSISRLASSSRAIGEIVSVIQDVASRTNLLALNASIEAASAGEVGRGFNIIAGEVKDLANQTASATEKITRMIESVQEETDGVIRDMEEGLRRVDEGKQLAGQAGTALEEIVASSRGLIDLVTEIARACEDQAGQSMRFLEQIQAVNEITESSASEIQGIADSTGNLEGLTERLRSRLGRFTYQAG